jgi:hypothetical protein
VELVLRDASRQPDSPFSVLEPGQKRGKEMSQTWGESRNGMGMNGVSLVKPNLIYEDAQPRGNLGRP